MENPKSGVLVVPLEIDLEQLSALQGALAFLADVCATYGIDASGAAKNDHPQIGFMVRRWAMSHT